MSENAGGHQGIIRIARFHISPPDMLRYYLYSTGFFKKSEALLIEERWREGRDESGSGKLRTHITVTIETHSAGFYKLYLKTKLYDIVTKKESVEESSSYIFPGNELALSGNILWSFSLKEVLSEDEYIQFVGIGYQGFDGADSEEDKSSSFTYGEEINLRLDVAAERMLFYGNYGRFKCATFNCFGKTDIDDGDIILRFHPCVAEYQQSDDPVQFGCVSRYQGSDNYRQYANKDGELRWGASVFDVFGIKERENFIRSPRYGIHPMRKEI